MPSEKRTARDFGYLGQGDEVNRASRIMIMRDQNRPESIQINQEGFAEVSNERVLNMAPKAGSISRDYDDVKDETVNVLGTDYTYELAMDILDAFIDKWRDEDEAAIDAANS